MTRSIKVQSHVIPHSFRSPMKIFSQLLLKGKWLSESGFTPGDQVSIEVTPNQIILRNIKKGGPR
jgi:hypothetical protein